MTLLPISQVLALCCRQLEQPRLKLNLVHCSLLSYSFVHFSSLWHWLLFNVLFVFVDVVPSSTQRHQDWFWCLCELKTHNLNPAENWCENKIWNQRLKEKKQNYCHSITFFIVSYLYFLRIRSRCTCTSDWSLSTSFDLAPSGFLFFLFVFFALWKLEEHSRELGFSPWTRQRNRLWPGFKDIY